MIARRYVLLLLLMLPLPLFAQFFQYETKNLRLIYLDPNHAYVVPHAVRCFENSLAFHHNLFDYTPSEKVTILFQDWNDYGSAGTNTIPWNFINVGLEPFDYVYETSPTNERMNWVMNHEIVHLMATDKANGSDLFFRRLFHGKVAADAESPLSMYYSYLTTPRWYSPRWYHEGLAVFMETWMSGGIGRALGGYDEMVFRTMVADSSYFYDIVGLESEGTTIDFQIGVNSYLYGARFINYLASQYGPDKLRSWYSRGNSSKRYFLNQFHNVYGFSLTDEWKKWITFEHRWQKDNLDSLRLNPLTSCRPITDFALGSVSRSFYDQKKNILLTAVNYPGQMAHIAAINLKTGAIKKICEVRTPALFYVASLAYDADEGKIFYTTNNSQSWRNLNVADVQTGSHRILMKNCRIGDLAFNNHDRTLWGVQHHNGYSTLVRIPPPYSGRQEILPLAYGKDLFDIDISPDGSLLTSSLIEINGRQRLISFNIDSLLKGDNSYEVLYEFSENAPQNFVFSADGNFLYGTSYYSGVSNVYRFDFQKKDMDAVSNCDTGFFRPTPMSPDSLIVFRYSTKGFLPVVIANQIIPQIHSIKFLGQAVAEKYPAVTSWILKPPSPSLLNLDTLVTTNGLYHPFKQMRLASVYPIVEGYKEYAAAGLRLNWQDPLGVDAIDATISYSPYSQLPHDQRFHAAFNYTHLDWTLSTGLNSADFYDLFGPTKSSRKGYYVGGQYDKYLIYAKPQTLKASLKLYTYRNLEKLPEYQNVNASFRNMTQLRVGLDYAFLQRSLGAVESEKGWECRWAGGVNQAASQIYLRTWAGLSWGSLLPLSHSSLWLRGFAGYAKGNRSDSFSKFYFGGFGNNWIDYAEVSRYRDYYSFPGAELNEIGGAQFGKLLAEWNLPPLRFRRLGIPSFYFKWARLSLFSAALATNSDANNFDQSFYSVGGQLDFRLVSFSLYQSTLSFGYANAFSSNKNMGHELMISFKIL
jgi:hypothetical protein